MNLPNYPTQDTPYSPFQFVRDACQQVIPIPTNKDLEGYLVYENGRNRHAQVRFLTAEAPPTQRAYKTVWRNFRHRNGRSIFPEMIAMDLNRETPFYVSELPSGEPLERFLIRTGPMLFQSALPLVLSFVESLGMEGLPFFERFVISPQSLWIEKNGSRPRLILGDIAPGLLENAEAANVKLCRDLLRYLAGNPRRNQLFLDLQREMKEGPQTISALEYTLKKYAGMKQAALFEAKYHEPIPMLQQLSSPLVMNPNASNLVNRTLPNRAPAAFDWPSLPGVGIGF